MVAEEKDRIYLYALVLDCSAAYFMSSIQKYVCTMKLIDETVNPSISNKTIPEAFSATFFSKDAGQLPSPRKVGSVIRIHRSQTKKNKNTIQLNCDTGIKGAWILFDPESTVKPVSSSSSKHTFRDDDRTILKKMRAFAKTYFEKHELKFLGLQDALKRRPKDFDTLCYVAKVDTLKDNMHVHLCDCDKVVKLTIANKRGLTFTPLTVVRLRGVDYESKSKGDHLVFKEYSNALVVSDAYKTAKTFLQKLFSGKASEEVQKQLGNTKLPIGEVISTISKKYKDAPEVSLKGLISGKSLVKGRKYYRLRLNVLEVGYKSAAECIRVHDSKTNQDFELNELFPKRKELSDTMEYYLKMQLFAKDVNTKGDTINVIFLCTLDNRGTEFLELPTGKKEPSKEYIKYLKKACKKITTPGTVLECAVEALEDEGKKSFLLFIVGTTLLTE